MVSEIKLEMVDLSSTWNQSPHLLLLLAPTAPLSQTFKALIACLFFPYTESAGQGVALVSSSHRITQATWKRRSLWNTFQREEGKMGKNVQAAVSLTSITTPRTRRELQKPMSLPPNPSGFCHAHSVFHSYLKASLDRQGI